MARKNGHTPDELETSSRYGSTRAEVDDYTLARSEFDADEVLDSARLSGDELDAQSPFLRANKRVPARRSPLPKRAANRIKVAMLGLLGLAIVGGTALAVRQYGLKSWRFRIESSDQIKVTGSENVPRAQILDAFGGDISRNVFAVPLEDRKKQLEQIPWVESATLMRHLPNRLAVVIKERTPVAFAQVGSRIALVDASSVLMEMSTTGAKPYSFPVIVGFTDSEPLSTRAARMKIYTALVNDLDSGGARYSQDLSEVDLSDPENAKVTVADGGVLVQLGSGNYLDRYKVYVAHVQEWRQQFGTLKSVDLRYEGQVVVDPGTIAENPAGGSQASNASPGAPRANSSAASAPSTPAKKAAAAKRPASRAKAIRKARVRKRR
jgi:cell division protein FtsQ